MRWWIVALVLPLTFTGCQDARARGPWAGQEYVALGDSYTSAPGTGTNLGRYCYQSARNYPRLVAAALDLELTDASCGGARIRHLTRGRDAAGAPPQFDSLSPGTDLVTLRIGANTSRLFGRTAAGCWQLAADDPTGDPCTQQLGGQAYLDRVAAQIDGQLTAALRRIARRAPEARIVVVGYPAWAPPATGPACVQLPLADGDVDFVRRANELVVEKLEQAAVVADVDYVDVWAATKGHHMCAEDPWIAGRHPEWTAARFHPYPEEQRATADLITQLLNRDHGNRGGGA